MMTKAQKQRAIIWTAAKTHLRHNKRGVPHPMNDNGGGYDPGGDHAA